MKNIKLLMFFLVVNFGGLYIGNLLMERGPLTDWYSNLNKAPWTPPGWIFGATWTLIMICFSFYLANIFSNNKSLNLKLVYVLQVVLNVSWNYFFFNIHKTTLALLIITALLIVIVYFFTNYKSKPKSLQLLLLPYIIWLSIATSLNLYVVIHN